MKFTSICVPFLGFLVASFFIQGLEATSCPLQWFFYEQHCYGFFEKKLSWHDAEAECSSQGKQAHLASIHNDQEMDRISSAILTNYGEGYRTWIGMYKMRGGKTRVRWVDASVSQFAPWAQNQPSNCQGKQNCVELYGNDYKVWNDQFCDMKRAYLCKMPV